MSQPFVMVLDKRHKPLTPTRLVQGIHHRHCHMLQRADGYRYGAAAGPSKGPLLPALKDGASAAVPRQETPQW